MAKLAWPASQSWACSSDRRGRRASKIAFPRGARGRGKNAEDGQTRAAILGKLGVFAGPPAHRGTLPKGEGGKGRRTPCGAAKRGDEDQVRGRSNIMSRLLLGRLVYCVTFARPERYAIHVAATRRRSISVSLVRQRAQRMPCGGSGIREQAGTLVLRVRVCRGDRLLTARILLPWAHCRLSLRESTCFRGAKVDNTLSHSSRSFGCGYAALG